MPTPDQEAPTVAEMLGWYRLVRDAAMVRIVAAAEADLRDKRVPFARESAHASYLRMMAHTNVHVRDIWMMRGELSAMGWPEQRFPR